MNVSEIFTSIQGESSYAGLPCVFIRLSGCNLRCNYCDTTYAYDGSFELTIDEIIDQVNNSKIRLVEITGGEPLLQEESKELMSSLIDKDYKVLIETNGSIDIKGVSNDAVIIMDIKTPSSGMSDSMRLSNIDLLKRSDEVKFVISNRNDYDWAVDITRKYSLTDRCKVLFSPVFGVLNPELLARWMIEDSLNVRLNLQLHKYVSSHSP